MLSGHVLQCRVRRESAKLFRLVCACLIISLCVIAEPSTCNTFSLVQGRRCSIRACSPLVRRATSGNTAKDKGAVFSRRDLFKAGNYAYYALLAYIAFRLPLFGYIAALGDPSASSGDGAEQWGIWRQDPGPRGVRLKRYDELQAHRGVATRSTEERVWFPWQNDWKFNDADWWLEEHGLIMPAPESPLPSGKYIVSGNREVTSTLTIHPKDGQTGNQRWELSGGAKLFDVTHLPCRSARYTQRGETTCSPASAISSTFPVKPGASMPPVSGCLKQDYAVLFVLPGIPL
eukprot:TRINITY_DN41450_c0_g1_i1.p1 TRINITY_DN41450_c0_g1~~TRINITY_DN41450_c0_g1_i1.p1  ORF type:complete len:289 (+),score=28.77 TRINITY_DN41450_c0_g1_i1:40-906(+)